MKKVIIIDDEAPARELIKEYLNGNDEWVIMGECNNGVDGLKLIREFKPDLVFLDIQMPGMTGFQVLDRLEEVPQIIFSTAYDQYALEAFEVNATDYLLKPYTRQRFKKALEKVQINQDSYMEQLRKLAESLQPETPKSFTPKLFVQTGNKLKAINTKDIIWLEADKDYTWLVTAEKRYLSSYGLGQLEEKLDPDTFLRVHRSSVININFIQEIEKHPSSYDLLMKNGDSVRVSRSYIEAIRKRIL
ncbi:MAG: LytTR family DNA-binding domain-containing protein [Bacteroidota bacterium]